MNTLMRTTLTVALIASCALLACEDVVDCDDCGGFPPPTQGYVAPTTREAVLNNLEVS